MKKLIALSLLLTTTMLQAQTMRYVSDTSLEANLRVRPSSSAKIRRLITSGTPVEALRVDSKKGYTLVRTKDGAQGWILTRYLMNTPSARERLASAEQALETLKAENNELKARLETLATEKSAVESDHNNMSDENQHLRQELTQIRKAAANTIAIDEQNKTLQEQVIELEREMQIVEQENQAMSDRSDKDWFLLGAGVLLLGVILGLIIPRLRWQKRNRWGDL